MRLLRMGQNKLVIRDLDEYARLMNLACVGVYAYRFSNITSSEVRAVNNGFLAVLERSNVHQSPTDAVKVNTRD